MTPPCHKCEERHYVCWADCEKYAAYRNEIDRAVKHLRKGEEADSFRTDMWVKGKIKRWKSEKK